MSRSRLRRGWTVQPADRIGSGSALTQRLAWIRPGNATSVGVSWSRRPAPAMAMVRDEDALDYHASNPPGKISVTATKPCLTQRDLSLAYTPGVAAPCLAIHADPDLVYKYTAKR